LGVSLARLLRYSKSASWIGLTCLTLPETTIFGGAKWTSLPAAFWNALAMPAVLLDPVELEQEVGVEEVAAELAVGDRP
jgi:hypothetical protein